MKSIDASGPQVDKAGETGPAAMKWVLLSPFTSGTEPGWLFDHMSSSAHSTVAEPATYKHDRSRSHASSGDWIDFFKHAFRGFRAAAAASEKARPAGLITVFPQLALAAAFYKKITGRTNMPIIAWCFNLARPYHGWKGSLARLCLPAVDTFVVHSRAEIDIYSEWLKLPKSRFYFVPLSAMLPTERSWGTDNAFESEEVPPPTIHKDYIVALGTANRDYELLVKAVTKLRYKTVIVAGVHVTQGLNAPEWVSFLSDLSLSECHRLAAGSRLQVIPVQKVDSPSGQVTVIESMMLGVPLIATSCAGTIDYIDDGTNGVLVPAGDLSALTNAIERVWNNADLRYALSSAALKTASRDFTFAAVAGELQSLMDNHLT